MLKEFQPNWVHSPADIINDLIITKGIDTASIDINLSKKISEKRLEINEDVASQLTRFLGGKKEYWINLQVNFDENLSRIRDTDVDCNFNDFKDLVDEMKNKEWLPCSEHDYIDQLNFKHFFGFTDYENISEEKIYTHSLGSQYKGIGSYEANTLYLATLMRKAELEANLSNIENSFNSVIFKERLQEIKLLSKKKKWHRFYEELLKICSDCGVAVVYLEALKGSPIRGVSKFINNKGLIVITTKYNKDNLFWQTFFHEAAHLILHQNQMLHLDCGDYSEYSPENEVEHEADDFMVSQLLYPYTLDEIRSEIDLKAIYKSKRSSWKNICNVSKIIDISPSLLVGILKFTGDIEYRFFNDRHKNIS